MQSALYDKAMPMKQMSLRLSAIQKAQVQKLSQKLQIDEANVIRLAITRLSEAEGIVTTPKR